MVKISLISLEQKSAIENLMLINNFDKFEAIAGFVIWKGKFKKDEMLILNETDTDDVVNFLNGRYEVK